MLVEETREVFLYETSCLINNIEDDVVLMMLGTCPRLLPKRQLLKYAMSQAATSKICNVPSGNFPKRSTHHCSLWRTLGKLPLGILHIWEVAAMGYCTCTFGKLPPWDIAHLGSCQGERTAA